MPRPRKTQVEQPVEADTITCKTLRKIGLSGRTSEINEIVELERDLARKLQDAGAIKVVI